MELLVEAGFKVSLETSGAFDRGYRPKRLRSYGSKDPWIGESHRNLMENISLLSHQTKSSS